MDNNSDAMSVAGDSKTRVLSWLTTAALSGAVVMALEMVAFRLYAPYFGYSIYIWANLIAVVMVALSIGYAFGGWLADKSKTDLPLYVLIFLSAIYQLFIIWTVHDLLPILAEQGEFTGTFLATLLIFSVPMVLLAAVGPYVIRLLARAGHVGTTAGRVYAISTIGSVAGIFATSFFLVPSYGTHITLQVICTTTVLIGLSGFLPSKRGVSAGLVAVAIAWSGTDAKWPEQTIWVGESAYNRVRIDRNGDRLFMILNQEQWSHSARSESSIWTDQYYDNYTVGPLLVSGRQGLLLGMGGGGSMVAAHAAASDIRFDAVEIDPLVAEAAKKYFNISSDLDWLQVHIDDARPWLKNNDKLYDLVQVDLFHGGPYVPFYLATVEFFQLVSDHMVDDALMMVNIFDRSKDKELLKSMLATIQKVFPTVAIYTQHGYDFSALAFNKQRSLRDIRQQLRRAEASGKVKELSDKVARKISLIKLKQDTPVFTDDLAPIEAMTRRMLADYRPAVK